MSLTIKKALDLPAFKGTRVVSANKKLNREIRWVHIGESVNMAKWLKGGELLLTCVHNVKSNRKNQELFLDNLAQKGAAAVGIEPGYYFQTIPEFMKNRANSLQLTLLEIPQGQPFIEISEQVIAEILKSEDHVNNGLCEIKRELEENLYRAIKDGLFNKAHAIIKDIIYMLEDEHIKGARLNYYLQKMLTVIAKAAIEVGADPGRIYNLKYTIKEKIDDLKHTANNYSFINSIFSDYIILIDKNINKHNNKYVQKTIKYLQNNYQHKVSLSELAEEVFLSTSYLSKLFKKELNKTITEFLTEVRLEEAKNYLVDTNMPLKNICKKVGFKEVSYFNKVFKKYEGLPPGKYRKKFVK